MKLSGLSRKKQFVWSLVLVLGMMAASTLVFASNDVGGGCYCPPESVSCGPCQYAGGWWKQWCTRTTYSGCACTPSTNSYPRLCSP